MLACACMSKLCHRSKNLRGFSPESVKHPTLDRLSSTIPRGTRLLSLQIKPDGIDLNLSQNFTQGGGSASMIYRVAQVLYTATSLDPQAKVYLSVEGKLLDEETPLGGEGLILQQPLTRQQFMKDLLFAESVMSNSMQR